MRNYLLILLILFISACGSPPIPQWKDTASRQLENYSRSFLTDREDATEPHFWKAKQAISSNNDLNLLATVYLTKYALHTAALEDFHDSEFLRIEKLQPIEINRTYYDFLKGNFAAVDAKKLPLVYSKVFPFLTARDAAAAGREISLINDPLSRLIACGICVKCLPVDEVILNIAIDTAARQGWRRPLWAYLNRLQQYYLDRQEPAKAENIRERLDLLKK